MGRYCAVYGCLQSSRRNKKLRFYNFPSNELRCKAWIKAICRKDLEDKSIDNLRKCYKVCELHFPESERGTRFLHIDAVPTLQLPQFEEPGTSKYTQTEDHMLGGPSTSRFSLQKLKLQVELKSEIKKRRLLESSMITGVNENLSNTTEFDIPPLIMNIIETQNVLKHKSQENRRNHEYVMFALNIYFGSPVCYQFLSETLCLPTVRTLQRHVAFSISTKFNYNIFKSLQSKSRNMSESEKYCIICADEMPLEKHLHYQINKDKVVGFHEINETQCKEIATKAFVVMARGIFSNWKQPLAFCFLNENKTYTELYIWLDNIIAKMIEIGFNVCAFTSGLDPNLVAKNKRVSPAKPYFFINSRKIYYIFDVPHLVTSLRNSLMDHNFVYKDDGVCEQVASWEDIEKMYDIEKNKKYKMTYKLTESHIRPNSLQKIHVRYAAQVMSRTVAVTICSLVESRKLQEKCMGTTKLLELLNDTFDILNSSTVKDDNKHKIAFVQAEHQLNTLEKVQEILSKLRVFDRNGKNVTNTMTFIKGFLTSIKAVMSLASELNDAGYNSLFTRRLNQEPLDKFFEKLSHRSGKYRKPSAIQVLTAFKKCFVVNLIGKPKCTNCVEDLDSLLVSVEEAQSSWKSQENVTIESSEKALQVGTYDYRFDLPEENALTCVCAYLLKKGYDLHQDCEVMKNYMKSNVQVDENKLHSHFKIYITDNLLFALCNPPEDFKQYIREIDSICRNHLINSNFYHIGNEIMTKINEIVFNLPCPCFPLEFIKNLFLRFRIFNVMQHNNKNFKDKSVKVKCFTVPSL